MTLNVGDRVEIYCNMGIAGEYFHGGDIDELPLGSTGVVQTIYGTNRIVIRLDNPSLSEDLDLWSVHSGEIRRLGDNSEPRSIGLGLKEEFKMAEKVFELNKSKYVNLEEDKSYLQLKLSDDLRELIKLFACEETETYELGKRHKVKNLLARSGNFNSYFFILFDEELLKKGKKDFEMDMNNYRNYSNQLEELESLVGNMLKIIQKENLTIKVQASTSVIRENLNVDER